MADMEQEASDVQTKNVPPDKVETLVSKVIHEYDVIEAAESGDKQTNDDLLSMVSEQRDNVANIESRGDNGAPMRATLRDDDDSGHYNNRHRLSSSDRSSSLPEDQIYELPCPRVNCPEKIIIFLDLSPEMDKLTFRSRAGDKFTPMQLVKRALCLFLQSKSIINYEHEFALAVLQDSALWFRDFTNNPKDITALLEDVSDTFVAESFDAASLYDVIQEKVELPRVEGDISVLPPPYIVRALFIYGRSNCSIHLRHKESMKLLESSPYFFLDALYVHEPPSEENKCQEIFDSICDLDRKGLSYILDACRNPTKLYDHMAQLLAHPLQRPLQRDTAYRIGSSIQDEG